MNLFSKQLTFKDIYARADKHKENFPSNMANTKKDALIFLMKFLKENNLTHGATGSNERTLNEFLTLYKSMYETKYAFKGFFSETKKLYDETAKILRISKEDLKNAVEQTNPISQKNNPSI